MNLAASIPDWIWRLFPDSMGGFISAVWLVVFWILRALALRGSENGSSPYRGLLCSAAAFCGTVALLAGALVPVALYHIQSFGLLLALVAVPVFLLAASCSYMFYRGARDGVAPRPDLSGLGSSQPGVDRKDAA
jgi:hypothetical protein